MKLTAVLMLKNEIDIIRDCCGHLSALFDTVIIIDHRSTDGTREYVDELSQINQKFQVYYLTDPGYYQSQLMTWIVKSLDICNQSDWLFLIDADEILPFFSRDEFEKTLAGYESSPIIRMPWKNLIPRNYANGAILGKSYLEPKSIAQHHKIAYQPSMLPISDYTIAQGNHAVLAGGPGKALPSTFAFYLYHVPIRSKEQLGFKIIQGTASYSVMGKERDESLGSHWFDISQHIKKYGISDELLNGLALRYGEPIETNKINIQYDKLLEAGCREIELTFACDSLPEAPQNLDSTEKIIRMLSDFQHSPRHEATLGDDVSIELNRNGEISFIGSKNLAVFRSLGEKGSVDFIENDLEFLVNFLQPATWKIESITPTSWGEHIPFLFCLISLLKPRVYAELGSHHGASFFAACQAMKKNSIDGKAIAIDLWEGDEHAGFYGESVYRGFYSTLNKKYSDIGESLRMSFDEAVDLFEEQSIDLLHIDGLHTYEAVKNDYETWRSKLTGNGVIIFHDTNVFEREFGVWQLWREISKDGVTFEFKHTHGLGVMALGGQDENPVVRLLTMINNSELLSNHIEGFFSRIGELTNTEAIIDNKKSISIDSSSSFNSLRRKIHLYRNALRNKIVNFIKSVPILRKTAYSILRFIRR